MCVGGQGAGGAGGAIAPALPRALPRAPASVRGHGAPHGHGTATVAVTITAITVTVAVTVTATVMTVSATNAATVTSRSRPGRGCGHGAHLLVHVHGDRVEVTLLQQPRLLVRHRHRLPPSVKTSGQNKLVVKCWSMNGQRRGESGSSSGTATACRRPSKQVVKINWWSNAGQ